MLQRLIFLGIFICIPGSANAQVLLSEIAWMGTADDANNEWIELYNHGAEDVSVEGWTIDDGGSLLITLTGTISANTIVLLERTDDTSVPSVSAFQTYTGALANDGRTLTLKDTNGSTIDQAVGGDNWESIGGNNETKETPQRTMTGWVTGTPTPGAENVTHDSNTNTNEHNDEENDDTNAGTSARRSGGGGSSKAKTSLETAVIEPDLRVSIEAPRIAYVNQRVTFKAEASGLGKTLLNSLVYAWNFGDTYTADSKEPSHVYEYPGDYVVVSSAAFASHHEIVRHEITVLPVSFTLTRTERGDMLLHNESAHEVDLGGFTLGEFTFPKFSIVKANGTITIPQQRIGTSGAIALRDEQRVLVASLGTVLPPLPVKPLPRLATPAPVETALSISTETSHPISPQTEVIELAAADEPTVIRIGDGQETQQGNVFSRFLWKISEFFNR